MPIETKSFSLFWHAFRRFVSARYSLLVVSIICECLGCKLILQAGQPAWLELKLIWQINNQILSFSDEAIGKSESDLGRYGLVTYESKTQIK